MRRDCEHGSLARSCEVCELQAEVKRLQYGIWKHREYVLREVGGDEEAQTEGDLRLWSLLDVAGDDREDDRE